MMLDADDTSPFDDEEPDLDAPRRKVVDPRTLPARFHHLKAAGACGALCLHAFQGDGADTLARRLGTGAHAVTFDKPIAVWNQPAKKNPKKIAPRSGDVWKEFQVKHAGKAMLTIAEHDHAQRIRDALHGHPVAARLLFGPGMVYERSIVWSELGRARQSTPDARRADHLVELKTTRCAAPWRFVRDAANMGYHAQLADQRAAIKHENGGRAPREVYIVAVENVPPYVVQVYELTPTTLEQGDKLRLAWLERLQIYEATNLWGGYSTGIEPLEILHDLGPAIADPEWVEDAGKEGSRD
ncbi:MAG: PD-(D/E)XK nuclease-like domain-containing protein [Mycobacteriales bacterium]|nr:PD-(D/E)XK nuclease-like domain-containing protein [Actinomycetota bacterium]